MTTCIALEGPDGVGKSTAAECLRRRLLQIGVAPAVRIRHFPTDALTACANAENRRLAAEDYAADMEAWLTARRNSTQRDATTYILDRWALSTAVYASLRNETVREDTALRLAALNRVPLATFVLLPSDPAALTDPDYPDSMGPYDPCAVTEAYRAALAAHARERGRFAPIVVDRARDTPAQLARRISEWVAHLTRPGA